MVVAVGHPKGLMLTLSGKGSSTGLSLLRKGEEGGMLPRAQASKQHQG